MCKFWCVIFFMLLMFLLVVVSWMVGKLMLEMCFGFVVCFVCWFGWENLFFFGDFWMVKIIIMIMDVWIFIFFMMIMLFVGF